MKTIFFDSVEDCYLKVLEKLITNKIIDVNTTGENGKTALHFAASYNNYDPQKSLDMIKILVEKGNAKFTTKDNFGNRPIDLIGDTDSEIYKYLSDKTEEYLLKLIAEKHTDKALMKTILFDSALYGYLEVLKKLITDKIIDVNTTGENGKTALHFAASYNNNDHQKSLDMIKILVGKGNAKFTTKDNFGNRPIDLIGDTDSEAYKYLSDKTEEYLLKLIAEKHTDKALMKTILFDSAHYGYLEVLKKLITDKIIDPNIQDNDKPTALNYAAKYSNRNPQKGFEIIKLLVEKGNAKITNKDAHNERPIDLIRDKDSETYKYLSDKTEELLLSSISQNKDNAELMKTIFLESIRYGYLKVFEKLVTDKIIDPNERYGDRRDTALHLIAEYSEAALTMGLRYPEKTIAMIKLLVEKGNPDDLFARNTRGQRPLDYTKSGTVSYYLVEKMKELTELKKLQAEKQQANSQ